MIRPFGLRDLGILHRYRRHALFLDSRPTLTWGRAIIPAGALLSPFSALTGVFTSLCEDSNGRLPLLGQVVHTAGSSYAHFTFLAPDAAMESPHLPELLEQLIKRVGQRGARSLVADVDESSRSFRALRQAGFSIFARQRIWQITRSPRGVVRREGWRPATGRDELAVDLLCSSLVPSLVQQIEPAPWGNLDGWVYYREGELLAYVDVARGPRGAWLQPFVHLDAVPFGPAMASLTAGLGPSRGKPLYVCQRSYQQWLEAELDDLGAKPGPQQAVMAKRTTRPVNAIEERRVAATENRRAEPTTPIRVPYQGPVIENEAMNYD